MDKLIEILSKMDVLVASQWENDGKPSLVYLSAEAGEDITQEMLTTIAPNFTRQTLGEYIRAKNEEDARNELADVEQELADINSRFTEVQQLLDATKKKHASAVEKVAKYSKPEHLQTLTTIQQWLAAEHTDRIRREELRAQALANGINVLNQAIAPLPCDVPGAKA